MYQFPLRSESTLHVVAAPIEVKRWSQQHGVYLPNTVYLQNAGFGFISAKEFVQRTRPRGSPLKDEPQEGSGMICPAEQELLQSKFPCWEQRHALALSIYSTGSSVAPAALAEHSALCQAEG